MSCVWHCNLHAYCGLVANISVMRYHGLVRNVDDLTVLVLLQSW